MEATVCLYSWPIDDVDAHSVASKSGCKKQKKHDWKNSCKEEKSERAGRRNYSMCERDGTETVSISSFPLKTKWKPPLIGLAEVTVCVCVSVYL